MRRSRCRAASLLALAGLVAGPAGAFECARVQPSSSRMPAYRPVPDAARCEGFYERTVSQPFVELVSLTRAPLPPTTTGPLVWQAEATGPALRLTVLPQRSTPFYRADAELPPGRPVAWDPAPMLAATGLRLADLGFLAVPLATSAAGSTPGHADPVFVPLSPAGQAAPPLQAHAVLRVSVDVAAIRWRAAPDAPGAAASAWSELPGSRLFAWQRSTLPLLLPADGGSQRIEVQAVAAADGRALPLLRFVVAGTRHGRP
ncbi:hypothetical protein [Aquincola sp. J276]|uniref:hypothetical protein n=1 Tax=Aquincola sp. J276 TaxID=2898432 RepID=UPI002151DF8E|nr:hypothetical protein [Aquincola sp. J276]MCR5867255.1 hypothetical protein [Aquincola sp. J276]